MRSFSIPLLILVAPILLMLVVLGLDAIDQCPETATLGLLCEMATFSVVFALAPAVLAGLSLVFRKRTLVAHRVVAIFVLFVYAIFLLYGERLISR